MDSWNLQKKYPESGLQTNNLTDDSAERPLGKKRNSTARVSTAESSTTVRRDEDTKEGGPDPGFNSHSHAPLAPDLPRVPVDEADVRPLDDKQSARHGGTHFPPCFADDGDDAATAKYSTGTAQKYFE